MQLVVICAVRWATALYRRHFGKVGIFMAWLHSVIDLFLHLDTHLNELVTMFGPWFYGVLFLVIFCETGLVVTPFLPGDSLLFAVGALAAIEGSILNLPLLAALCFIAAFFGNLSNYTIGRFFGARLFGGEGSRFLRRDYLDQTEAFYARHGGKTVVLARFIPIVRTFAPFVAGIGAMNFFWFTIYSIAGAAFWIVPFLAGGYYLGNNPVVKTNFHLVMIAIIVISVAPAVIHALKARRSARLTSVAPPASPK